MSTVEGFLSCICVARNANDLRLINDYSVFLATIHRDYEIIVCVRQNTIERTFIEKHCNNSTSLAIYEISASSLDDLFTAGMELALGDWILELPNTELLIEDTASVINLLDSDLEKRYDAYQLLPKSWYLPDRLLSHLSSLVLEVPVRTVFYVPRLTKRHALQIWNTRKLRSKVIRVAPQLGRGEVLTERAKLSNPVSTKRLIRIGLRTLVHSSAKPLRWVSYFSLVGAFISVLISAVVLIIGISRKVVPGWTTTNLQISGLSFLILLVLGVLTEYIYQIAAASIDQPSFRLVREYISRRYIFKQENNINRTLSADSSEVDL